MLTLLVFPAQGQGEHPTVSLGAAVRAAWAEHPALSFSASMARSGELLTADGERVLGGSPTLATRYNSDRLADNVGEEEWEVIINLPIMPLGERHARTLLGQQSVIMAERAEQAYRLQVAGEVRALAADLRRAQLERRLQVEQVASAEALLQFMDALVQSGARPTSDLLQVRAALLESNNALHDAEQAVQHHVSQWRALTGLQRAPSADAESQSAKAHEALLSEHPTLLLVEAQLGSARAKADLEQARWTTKPVVGFGYRGQQANAQSSSIESVGLYFEVPLDFGGFNHRAESEAEVTRARAEMNWAVLKRRLKQALHDAELAIKSTDRALALARQRDANARELLDIAKLQFEVDRISVLEFLAIRASYWQARGQLASQTLERDLAISRFNQAAGEMPQ